MCVFRAGLMAAEHYMSFMSHKYSTSFLTFKLLFFKQSNEVNQGDALEHNFSALHSALLFPVTHLLRGAPLQQVCTF